MDAGGHGAASKQRTDRWSKRSYSRLTDIQVPYYSGSALYLISAAEVCIVNYRLSSIMFECRGGKITGH